ncbi:S8 family serine peptidase [Algivirga pacifica]|uniref:PKD domain-containing protein n=1 Tax=Algivirga pacifica TaxID=1162670 RepID=A0ABP9DGZ5_9BACT
MQMNYPYHSIKGGNQAFYERSVLLFFKGLLPLFFLTIASVSGNLYAQGSLTGQQPSLLLNADKQGIQSNYLMVKFKSATALQEVMNTYNLNQLSEDKKVLSGLLNNPMIIRKETPLNGLRTVTSDVLTIEFKQGAEQEAERTLAQLKKNSNILSADYMPLDYIFEDPNDPRFGEQYYLELIGAIEAWGQFDNNAGEEVVVAIIDDAIRINHEDLKANIYTNPNEIPGNGIDDDGNGYIDDVNGWDPTGNEYTNGDPDPSPPDFATTETFSHGTHTAGLAGAVTNNNKGIASVSNGKVKILPIKATRDDTGDTRTMTHTMAALRYAITMGADVVSMSYGSYSYNSEVQRMISAATLEKNMLFIAAAGNDNVSASPFPAGYVDVIAVANTTQNDTKSESSQYGTWIDISAPGTDILSTTAANDSDYGFKTGTSMACPIAAGAAALLKAQNPSLTPRVIENILKSTAKDLNAANPDYANLLGAGRIDLEKAMEQVKGAKPLADFDVTPRIVTLDKQVRFTNYSFGNNLTYEWNFGDGTISSEENPTHTYTKLPVLGQLFITLKVTDGNGNSDQTRIPVEIIEGPPEVNQVSVPYRNTFGDEEGEDPSDFVEELLYGGLEKVWERGIASGPVLEADNYVWKTGLNTSIPNETYGAALYTPSFDLTDLTKEYKVKFKYSMHSTYCNAPAAAQIQYSIDGGGEWILLGGMNDPKGENWFNKEPGTPCDIHELIIPENPADPNANQTGWITNVNSEQAVYNISSLSGNTDVRFRFVFYMNGAFQIPDTDDGFMIEDFEITATPPQATFSSADVAYEGQRTSFNYTSGGATSYLWEFGDGNTSEEENPDHVYNASGIYKVTLTVSGGATSSKDILVISEQVVPFTLADGGDLEGITIEDALFYTMSEEGSEIVLGQSKESGKDSVSSGETAFVLDPDTSNYLAPTLAYLYTPAFDLTQAKGNYFLEYKIKHDITESDDGIFWEYSTDGGLNWYLFKQQDYAPAHWYNNFSSENFIYGRGFTIMTGSTEGEFVKKYINVNELLGQKVAFRMTFAANGSVQGSGFALDDIQIVSGVADPTRINVVAARYVNNNLEFTETSFPVGVGDIVLFIADVDGDYLSYEWDFGEGAEPRSGTGAGLHWIYYTTEGAKDVTLTIPGGADGKISETRKGFVRVGAITSVEDDIYNATALKAYPNPLQGNSVHLALDNDFIGALEVKLYGLDGTLLKSEKLRKGSVEWKHTLELPYLPQGLFLLRIESAQGAWQQKIIKQ